MQTSSAPHARLKAAIVLLLAFTAGWVDAVGFIVLWKLFIAHMSGNSIAMTVYLGEGDWQHAFHRGFAIPCFLIGIGLGMVLNEVLLRRGVRSIFAFSLLLEAVLLTLFALLTGLVNEPVTLPTTANWRFYGMAALPLLAMGLQNATLRRVAGTNVRTTYISGVLTNCVEECVKYLFWRRDQSIRQSAENKDLAGPRPSIAGILFLAGIWLGYATGGLLGSITQSHSRLHCLDVPIGCLLVAIATDLVTPLAALVPKNESLRRD